MKLTDLLFFFESLKVESGTVILNAKRTLKFEFMYKSNYIVKISEIDFTHMLKIIAMRSCNNEYSNCIISAVIFGNKSLRFDISFSNYFKENSYEFFKLPSELEEIKSHKNPENFEMLKEYNLFNICKDLKYLDIILISPSIHKKIELKLASFDNKK